MTGGLTTRVGNWVVSTKRGQVVLLGMMAALMALGVYATFVARSAKDDVARNSSRLNAESIRQRTVDLRAGCERSTLRLEAEIKKDVGDAISAGTVGRDTAAPPVSRHSRQLNALDAWEAAMTTGSTLVDCMSAYPDPPAKSDPRIDTEVLLRVREKVRARYGPLHPADERRLSDLISQR